MLRHFSPHYWNAILNVGLILIALWFFICFFHVCLLLCWNALSYCFPAAWVTPFPPLPPLFTSPPCKLLTWKSLFFILTSSAAALWSFHTHVHSHISHSLLQPARLPLWEIAACPCRAGLCDLLYHVPCPGHHPYIREHLVLLAIHL